MSTAKGVIFDLDGCLVDSEPLSLEAIASEMRALGIKDATEREVGDQFLGVAMPVIVQYVAKRLGSPVPPTFAARVESRLLSAYERQLRPIPGAKHLLVALRSEGIGTAIATGASLRRMAATLDLGGLSQWFEGTASSADEVENGKPAPDLFLLAAERLHLRPEECVVVEDSPHGIVGANAAGIPAIGFVGGSHLTGRMGAHTETLLRAGAVEVFGNLSEVEASILDRTAKGRA